MQSHIKPIDTLKCDKCGMYFENEQLLGEHLKLHEDAEPFQCVLCKKLYTSYRTLYCHCNHSHVTKLFFYFYFHPIQIFFANTS